MTQLKDTFFRYNSRPGSEPFNLSPYFMASLDRAIDNSEIAFDADKQITYIVNRLKEYRKDHNIEDVVLGVSGGIDSAVVAALFKEANWNVTGYLLPINQEPTETERGMELVEHLGIDHKIIDLSEMHDAVQWEFLTKGVTLISDADLNRASTKADAIRRGNVKARMRMLTLYELAAQKRGLVASTDNFSELAAGFWTLHGDVGDVAPIQSLTKSWEVPQMAEALGLPTSIVHAAPTDGLGIDDGDEAQFGYTYAQADLIVLDLINNTLTPNGMCKEDERVTLAVKTRLKNSAFKRANPTNIDHPNSGSRRYERLAFLDRNITL